MKDKQAKIFLFDIETSPLDVWAWGMYDQNIGIPMLKKPTEILTWSGKYLGEDQIYYEANTGGREKVVVQKLVDHFNQADILMGHNVKSFDIRHVNARALYHGIAPPSPYKVIDTLMAARRFFKIPSNKLEYLATYLGLTPKLLHKQYPGFLLWDQFMKGNASAQEEMRLYNIRDTTLLEEVYLALRPWIANHPNMGVYTDGVVPVCKACGSADLRNRGVTHTSVGIYQRYRCTTCGAWSQGRENLLDKDKRKGLLK